MSFFFLFLQKKNGGSGIRFLLLREAALGTMFELLLHGLAAGSWAADHTAMLAGAGQIKEQPHMAAKDLFQNHQLNLVAGPNEVYNR